MLLLRQPKSRLCAAAALYSNFGWILLIALGDSRQVRLGFIACVLAQLAWLGFSYYYSGQRSAGRYAKLTPKPWAQQLW